MATVTRYVDLNSTAGGDGTTSALTGTNRAFASMDEWQTAMATNLVTAGDISKCVLVSGGILRTHTAAFALSGWTTDASNYVHIVADSSVSHLGNATLPYAHFDFSNVGGGATGGFRTGVDVLLEGLSLYNNSLSCYHGLVVHGTGHTIIKNCFIMTFQAFTGVYSEVTRTGTISVLNSVIRGAMSAILNEPSGVTLNAYNSIFHGAGGYAIDGYNGIGAIKNCYLYANSTRCIQDIGGYTLTTSATSNTQGSASLQNISATAVFEDWTASNVMLEPTAVLRRAGTDTSGDAYPFNTQLDMLGNKRLAWDIGVFAYNSKVHRPLPTMNPTL